MKSENWIIIGLVLLVLMFALLRPSIDLLPENSTSEQTAVTNGNSASTKGIDVSYYQGDISWASVSGSGIAFAYLKATEGETLADPQYANNVKKLKDTGIQFGSYHFFQAKDDADKQAAFFLSQVSLDGQLPPVLDIEVSQGESADSIKSSALAWLKAVESNSGCKPVIYTYKDFWEENLGSEFSDYPLWLADYADQPGLPAGVANYLFWQYSETGQVDGISGNVDLNVYSGSAEDLKLLLCKP